MNSLLKTLFGFTMSLALMMVPASAVMAASTPTQVSADTGFEFDYSPAVSVTESAADLKGRLHLAGVQTLVETPAFAMLAAVTTEGDQYVLLIYRMAGNKVFKLVAIKLPPAPATTT
jgi:hypothetical protein